MAFGYILPADYLNLGGVIPDGVTLAVDPSGVLSVLTVPPAASTLELTDGITDLLHVSKLSVSAMQVGGTRDDATLAPVLATEVNPGIMQPDGNSLYVDQNGIIGAVQATTQNRGIVQPDGTTITIDDQGVISAPDQGIAVTDGTNTVDGVTSLRVHAATIAGTSPHASIFPDLATASSAGIVAPDGASTAVDAEGHLSALQATASSRGIVQPDDTTITIDDAGVISAQPSLELTDGTHDLTQVRKISTTHMNVGGTADAATLAPALASTANPGIVQPDGTSIDITDDGVISAAHTGVNITDGTHTVDGATQLTFAGATVSGTSPDATITPHTATTAQLGVVQVDGSSITATEDGVISATAVGLPNGAEGDLLYYHDGEWVALAPGSAGDVLTSTGSDPLYDVARIAMAANDTVVNTRHEIDLGSSDGSIVVTPTDDSDHDAVHYDLALGNPTGTTLFLSAPGNETTLFADTSGAVPANWYTNDFDDSAWTPSVAEGTPGDPGAGWASFTAGGGSTSVTHDDVSVDAWSYTLFRRSVTIPTGTISSASMVINPDNYIDSLWINGHQLYDGSSYDDGPTDNSTYNRVQQTISVSPALLIAGGNNLIAIGIRNGALGGPSQNPCGCAYVLSVVQATAAPTSGIAVAKDGTLVGSEPEINLIAGPNISLAVADNTGAKRVDVTISAAGGGGGGGTGLIDQIVVGNEGQATIEFSNIPQIYQFLRLVVSGRSTSGNQVDVLQLIINSDTGTNYDYAEIIGASPVSYASSTAQGYGRVGVVAGGAAASTVADAVIIDIPDYSNTTFWKSLLARGRRYDSNTFHEDYLTWHNTGAITDLTLKPAAGSFAQGTIATLYGLGGSSSGGTGLGGPSALTVQDDSGKPGTVVQPTITIDFSGAAVSDAGNGQANVLVPDPIPYAFEGLGGSDSINFTAGQWGIPAGGIPQSARHLRIEGQVRSASTSGSSGTYWGMTLNGVTTGYVFYEMLLMPGTAPTPTYNTGQPIIPLGGEEAAPNAGQGGLPTDSDADHYISFVIDIPYYSTPSAKKSILYEGMGAGNAGQNAVSVRGQANSVAGAITQVNFGTMDGSNFSADSRITLYVIN